MQYIYIYILHLRDEKIHAKIREMIKELTRRKKNRKSRIELKRFFHITMTSIWKYRQGKVFIKNPSILVKTDPTSRPRPKRAMFKKSLPISSKRTKKVDALPDIRNLFKLKKKQHN